MALNRFNDILNRVQNSMVDSMKKDVKDLRNDEFKAQMNKDRQKADNQQLWDKYKRTGEKIDVPEFDASVQDLPENDEYEKEIKVVPQEPKGTSFYVPSGQKDNYSLEQLAGNGMSEEEIPEPKEPKGTSFNLPKEENPEWDLEDEAGNGQRYVNEDAFDTRDVVDPEEEDKSIIDELHKDDPVGEVDEEGNLIPPKEEEPPAEEENNGGVETPEFDESDVADPEDNPDIPTDEEIENAESGEEETPEEDTEEENTDEEESEEDTEEEPKEKTKTEQGPINDDSDLIKKGSGVSVSDMVDRSQIPHYDYLSFFR